MQVMRLRRQIASTAVVVGALLLVVAVVATVNAISVVTEVLPSDQLHDTYFVVSGAWIGLVIYGAGVAGDLAFRATATRLGRSARVIWQTHLLFTTLLLIVALAAGAGALINGDWQMALVLNATYILMLLAHGTALALGGMLFLRAA